MKDSTLKPTSIPPNGGQAQTIPQCTYNNPEPMGNARKYKPSKQPQYNYSSIGMKGGKGNFKDDAK